MSTTALAISTAAQAQANLAQAEASRARTLACKVMMQTFESKTATVDMRQDYASCVGRLYPTERWESDSALAATMAIAIGIAAICLVIYWVKEELVVGVVAGFFGFCGTWLGFAAIAACMWAIKVLT